MITTPKLEPIIRKERPVEKEEFEDGIKVEKITKEEIPEEIITEEKLPEEELVKKKIPDERIVEEKIEEKVERIDVEKKDEAVQTDVDIDESSDSIYSYSMYDNDFFRFVLHKCIL